MQIPSIIKASEEKKHNEIGISILVAPSRPRCTPFGPAKWHNMFYENLIRIHAMAYWSVSRCYQRSAGGSDLLQGHFFKMYSFLASSVL